MPYLVHGPVQRLAERDLPGKVDHFFIFLEYEAPPVAVSSALPLTPAQAVIFQLMLESLPRR
jgi:hypothetical protein